MGFLLQVQKIKRLVSLLFYLLIERCAVIYWERGLNINDVSAYLELSERKSTSCTNTTVVFDCGASDDGAEFVDWAGRDGSNFYKTGIATMGFSAGLWGWSMLVLEA